MLCQVCQKNPATLEVTQIDGGIEKPLHVCEACASKKTLEPSGQLSLSDFLVSLNAQDASGSDLSEVSCPECHMRKTDFKQSSLLGCPSCYDAFAEDIAPLLRQLHRSGHHVGKIPLRAKLSERVHTLEQQLGDAVGRQDFEGAAGLRDEIAELRRTLDAGVGGQVSHEA